MKSLPEVTRSDLEFICEQLRGEFGSLAGRKLLITGGGGFLGYYLAHAPLWWNRCHRDLPPIHVTVIDNFIRGMPAWLAALQDEEDCQICQHDITQPGLPPGIVLDYVMHAASIASPTYYRQHPLETMDANVQGLRTLLDRCRQQQQDGVPVASVLFFSTSEIYGDPPAEHIPTPETYRGNVSCTGPRACYDESKRYGETLSVTFARQYGVPVKIVRPFNNYGPGLGLDDRRLIPDFARCVLAGEDIVMHSDGAPTRTFCYVADAVVGFYKVLLRGRAGEPYNIGSDGPEVSVAELAARIVAASRELFDYQGQVVHRASEDRDYLVDNPLRRCPDISKARSELGFSPRFSLDEGLNRSLKWYRHTTGAAK